MAGRKNAHVFGTNLIRVPLLEQGIFCTISDAITLNFLVCVKLRFNLIMKKKTLVTAIINTIILRLLFKSLLKLKLLTYCKSFVLQCFNLKFVFYLYLSNLLFSYFSFCATKFFIHKCFKN